MHTRTHVLGTQRQTQSDRHMRMACPHTAATTTATAPYIAAPTSTYTHPRATTPLLPPSVAASSLSCAAPGAPSLSSAWRWQWSWAPRSNGHVSVSGLVRALASFTRCAQATLLHANLTEIAGRKDRIKVVVLGMLLWLAFGSLVFSLSEGWAANEGLCVATKHP